ncbi:MAG: hypothetical protein PHQ14_03910 [Chromatiales bacterium]|nr:hypothetical protein [Chromatiales bacterium]
MSSTLDALKADIIRAVAERARLLEEMEHWYAAGRRHFPRRTEMEALDARLSELDTQYKRLWDTARQRACE